MEEKLILGPGWVQVLESGDSVPHIDLLIAMAEATGVDLSDLVAGIRVDPGAPVGRVLSAEKVPRAVALHFPYGDFDAAYEIPGARMADIEAILKELRNGLASGSGKADVVKQTFLTAIRRLPKANPSDLWWFLVYRAYIDPFNHPAVEARRNLDQSWKRTSGWALERIVVAHYKDALAARGIRIFIGTLSEKRRLLPNNLARRLEQAKVDVLLTADHGGSETFFGVVNVKASFAERRTDDVPLSEALMGAGYTSIFWTMDCKSVPSARPINRGELGKARATDRDQRSAKRRDFEVEGSFSACFSYNDRTDPTPPNQEAVARVFVASFADPDDPFTEFVAAEWSRFKQRRAGEA